MHDLFANPFWYALGTEHANLAIGPGLARRYPAAVIPFAAVASPSTAALAALCDLLTPGEHIYLTGDHLPQVPGLAHPVAIPGLQMHLPSAHLTTLPAPRHAAGIVHKLGPEDAAAMVGLTDVAFPGFFRARTCTLGSYFGVRLGGDLVAMAGERLALPGFREISAVCTHPAHTGKGYAALLIQHLLRVHAANGLRSFLHLVASNTRALGLYQHLGFTSTREIVFNKLERTGP